MPKIECRDHLLKTGRRTLPIGRAALGFGIAGALLGAAPADAQTVYSNPEQNSFYSSLLPPSHNELADQERLWWSLKKFPPQSNMHEVYWQMPPDTPAFFRDSMLQYVARSYLLTRDNLNGTKSSAWAAGGWLAYRSGLIADMFGVHAAFYTSQPLWAPIDQDGTRLLAPGQNSIGVLGQIYGRIQIADQEIRIGRQLVDTPLINPQDNRMVPNTFEGGTLVSLPDPDRKYDYVVGYLTTMKARDSNDFISMTDRLTDMDVVNRGAAFGMIRVRPLPGLSFVAMDYAVPGFINSSFGQVEYDFQQPKGMPNWIVGANVIGQRSIGSDFVSTPSFQTYQASGKVAMNYMGWTLFVAGSITGDGSFIYSPYGGKPTYTDMQQRSFDNAGEKALGASAAYDVGSLFGISGLSTGIFYTQGWGLRNALTAVSIPDERELDLWLQYRPSDGPLKGLRFKTQYGQIWQDGNVRSSSPEFRVIVDYTILFRPPPPAAAPLVTKY